MKIYFMLSKTGTVLSRLIRLFSKYPYNHISFGFKEDLSELYSIGRKNPKNPFSGGLVIENINEGLYKMKKNTECIVFSLKITKDQYSRIQKEIERFFKSQSSYRYNTMGLIRNHFKKGSKNKENRYFCSEFISEVLRKASICDFGKPDEHVKPQDFLELKDVSILYEGRLTDYPKK